MKKAFSKKNLREATPPIFNKLVDLTLSVVLLEYLIGRQFSNTTKLILSAVKYAMHKENNVLRQSKLVYGTKVNEFMRCNLS